MTAAESRPFHHGDLRQALLAEAARLVEAQGAEAFSLREAARAVGVSPAAAYRHFEDKGALLAALAGEGFVRLAAAMEIAMDEAGADPVGRLRANGLAYIRFGLGEPAMFALMFGPFGAGGQYAIGGVGPRTGLSAYELLCRALDDLVKAGRITPARRAGAETLLWTSVHGLATLANARVLHGPAEEAFEGMFGMLREALGMERASKPGGKAAAAVPQMPDLFAGIGD